MFYVSHINGSQSSYLEEVYRSLRQKEIQQVTESEQIASDNETQGIASTAEAEASVELNTGESISNTESSKINYQGASASAIGTASASVMKGVSASGQKSNEAEKIPKKKTANKNSQVEELQAPFHIKEKPDEQLKSRKYNPYSKIDIPQKQRSRALTAEEIMTTPVETINMQATLAEAAKLFEEKRFRHVPVLNDKQELVGILSDRDYLRYSNKQSSVKDCMATQVLTARPETEIRLIAHILFKEKIGAMPIVDNESNLVGILTRSDILCALVNKAPLEIWV